MAIDRTEVTVFIGPLVPDRDSVVLEILDIGVACNEPQKLVDYRFEVHFLGGEQRKALAQVETHLVAEHALRAGAGAVALHCSVFTDMS